MGACLSCLGIRDSSSEAERTRLLSDDPYNTSNGAGYGAGAWGQQQPGGVHGGIPPQNVMSPEEVKRERQAMDNIMRWASDQIVEIFPHGNQRNLIHTTSSNSTTTRATADLAEAQQQQYQNTNGNGDIGNLAASTTTLHHQDILLSMIPGDKSKRSIRIYPASRPASQDAQSVRSKASQTMLNGGSTRSHASGVFVKLNVDLP